MPSPNICFCFSHAKAGNVLLFFIFLITMICKTSEIDKPISVKENKLEAVNNKVKSL